MNISTYVTQAGGWPYLVALPLTLVVCGILGVAYRTAGGRADGS